MNLARLLHKKVKTNARTCLKRQQVEKNKLTLLEGKEKIVTYSSDYYSVATSNRSGHYVFEEEG